MTTTVMVVFCLFCLICIIWCNRSRSRKSYMNNGCHIDQVDYGELKWRCMRPSGMASYHFTELEANLEAGRYRKIGA